MASSTPNRLSGYLPLLAFLSAWTIQFIYFLVYEDRIFYTFQFNILFLILTTVLSYTFGFLSVRQIIAFRATRYREHRVREIDKRAFTILMRTSIIFSILIIIVNIAIPLVQGLSLSGARQIALDNWEEGSLYARLFSIIVNITISFCLVVILDSIDLKNKLPFYIIIIFLLLSIAAYSRAHLLLGLCIISVKWISQSEYRISFIFSIFSLFAIVFSLVSIFSSLNQNTSSSAIDEILKNLEVYVFAGVAGFEFYYNSGYPEFNNLLTLPRFIYFIIPGLGNPPPSYFPFVDTTPPINVFSAMYPPFHDFGIYGLIFFFFFYGLVSSIVITAFNIVRNRTLGVLSGFFLYAALISPFDDQFIRGSTVLILMLSGVALYSLIYRILLSAKERRFV